MAPVASATTNENTNGNGAPAKPLLFNPVSPYYKDSGKDDGDYKYTKYKPVFPDVHWEPLTEVAVSDRGLHADPSKRNLLSAASKVTDLTPVIGTEILGVDLRQLSPIQKDELALLVAERGVVFFRDQELNIHEQLDLARHYGPLHKHASTPIPREPGLEEVHVVYNDSTRRPDTTGLTKLDLWHSDVSYELQPPSTTSLKLIAGPPVGGDTHWVSGCALYSSFSPGFQKYLEGLSALHSAVAQADGSKAAGLTVRREPVESIHPVVRVHPVTGWKSIYVNPGFTRKIVGVPKAESDAVLRLLFHKLSENLDLQVRYKWKVNTVAIWDNRPTPCLSTSGQQHVTRHALRATPHGERPQSVADYESQGKVAKDRQLEIWKQQGIEPYEFTGDVKKPKGYND